MHIQIAKAIDTVALHVSIAEYASWREGLPQT